MSWLRCGLCLLGSGVAGVVAGCGAIVIPGDPPSGGGGRTNPVITWATPAPITNPTPLSAAQLDATANMPGTFVYRPAAGTVLAAGARTLSTTFMPADSAHYKTVRASVQLTVLAPVKANPVITWATPAPITNPTPLSATQLDATANVAGTFVYTPPAGTVLAAGNQTLSTTFTPTDTADYNTVSATVTLVVNAAAKTNPVITWATPAPITHPTPLSATQLDATANVAGTFVYTPPAGTVLAAGSHILSTTFTPTDTAAYNTVSATVTLVVNAAVHSCLPPAPVGGPSVQPGSGTWLAVADAQNNRVLIYPAPFTTDEDALVVLGQPDMTHDAQNQQCNAAANTLLFPEGLAVDAAGDLYVADTGNCRVLEFEPPFTTDMSASRVIGEPDMDHGYPCLPTSSAGPDALLEPTGVAVDAAGNLWVADHTGGRVTAYAPPFTNGMAATLAIGQSNLTDSWSCDGTEGQIPVAPTAANLCGPRSLGFDGGGDLWVVDTGTQRALEYVPPFATGMEASVELGHPPGAQAFTTAGTGYDPPTTTVNDPYGMAVDAGGNLWIGSPTFTGINNEMEALEEFSPAFSDGMSGSLAASTEPGNTPPTADRVMLPWAMFGDGQGNLMVADEWYNRVLIFAAPLGPGMSASVAIGQPNMTSMERHGCPEAAPARNTLCGPEGVVVF